MTANLTPSEAASICSATLACEHSAALTSAALDRIATALASRDGTLGEREAAALTEDWSRADGCEHPGTLAYQFMQRFAPISQRLPGGLAFTAISTLRLEHPIRQQEDFNRACLMLADWAVREATASRRLLTALEERVAQLEQQLAGRSATQAPPEVLR